MGNVHRALLMALTWVAGTAAGVVLGWQGVQLVTFQVVESQAAPLSQPHVLEALEAAGGSPGPAAVSPATPEIPAPQAAPTPTPVPPKVLPRSGGHLPAPLAPGAGSPPASVTVTAAAAPTTTTTVTTSPAPVTTPTAVAKEPTTTTTTRAKPKQEPKPAERPTETDKPVYRMIPAKGGTVAVRFQSGHVQLLWARPNDGFRVDVEEDGDEEVVVVFRSRDHRSRIRAFWANGTPRQQVVEHPTGKNSPSDDD
jgi:hypothetical protein